MAALLAAVGVAGGYGVGALQTTAPATISVAAPVPAQDPSYPMVEYDVQPDPDVAPLGSGLPLAKRTMREGGYRIDVSVPRRWVVGELDGPGWNFSVASNPTNTYVLRVEVIAGTRSSVAGARSSRIVRLESSAEEGNLEHLVVEDTTDDGFTASYVQGGYRRVTQERFLTLGGTTAYATVAVSGRERDREGMADLLERVSASLAIPS